MPTKPLKKLTPKLTKPTPSNPSIDPAALPWVEPFPEALFDDKGKDTVMVRATPTRDIRINGHLLHAGRETTLPCSVAHAHADSLVSPDIKE